MLLSKNYEAREKLEERHKFATTNVIGLCFYWPNTQVSEPLTKILILGSWGGSSSKGITKLRASLVSIYCSMYAKKYQVEFPRSYRFFPHQTMATVWDP